MKIIKNWLFINHLWRDAEPSPLALNINNIVGINETYHNTLGTHVIIHTTDGKTHPVEGDIITILSKLEKHLTN